MFSVRGLSLAGVLGIGASLLAAALLAIGLRKRKVALPMPLMAAAADARQ